MVDLSHAKDLGQAFREKNEKEAMEKIAKRIEELNEPVDNAKALSNVKELIVVLGQAFGRDAGALAACQSDDVLAQAMGEQQIFQGIGNLGGFILQLDRVQKVLEAHLD